jgi:ankyrin repeat protein
MAYLLKMYKNKITRILAIVILLLTYNNLLAFNVHSKTPSRDDSLQYMNDDDEYNLVVASIKGDLQLVENLINKGISPNTVLDESLTPLIYAAQGGQLKTCMYLISKGADVNFRPVNGSTPLIAAVRMKHYNIVDFLINKGSNINLGDEFGRTPLMHAIAKNDSLLFNKFLKNCQNINQKDTSGADALLIAVVCQQLNFAEQLIKAGASVNTCDDMGVTPLMIATSAGNYKLIDLLFNNKADLNQITKSKQTALIIAIEKKDEALIQYLIDKGADVNQKLTPFETPLSVANYLDCNVFIIEALTSKNAKKGFLPDYRKFIIGPEISWNLDEFMTGVGLGFKDYRYNSDLTIGFLTRPMPSRIRVSIGNNEYFQYWEKRSYFYGDVIKKFAIQHKNNDLQRGFFLGVKGLYSYSEYRGTDINNKDQFYVSPEFGIYQSNKYCQITMSYMYADFATEGISSHKINLSFKFFLGKAFNFSNDDYKPWE